MGKYNEAKFPYKNRNFRDNELAVARRVNGVAEYERTDLQNGCILEMHRMQLSFSKDATMGRLIHDILYRELKEYLERWGGDMIGQTL